MDVLVVASKIKAHIKKKHDMNTSASVMEALSHEVVKLIDAAAENAKSGRRKTIMDKDFQ